MDFFQSDLHPSKHHTLVTIIASQKKPQMRQRSCPHQKMQRLLLVCSVMFFTSCAHTPRRAQAVHALPLPAEIAAYYDYPDHAPVATIQLIKEYRNFRVALVRFPLSTPSGVESTEPIVEFEWFESKRLGRRAAIVFNPILGGDYPLERSVCRFFASRGYHVALVHRKTLKISPAQRAEQLELLLRQGILRIRQVVDWMTTNERVDPHRLGSFGISMGGIASEIAAAVEPRLRVHVIALAGGGIADIVSTSHDPLIARPRRRYLERNHISREDMYRILKEGITTDPLRMAPYVDRDRLLMFITLADRTIGTSNAFRLWHALGQPRAVFLPAGHYTAYLLLPYIKYASLQFFDTMLGPGS